MSSAQPEVVLVRHGETEWTQSGRHTSRTDIPLTDGGRLQAASVGRFLQSRTFTTVFSSPRSRALETCRLSGVAAAAPVVVRDELAELDYGVYEGRTTSEIRTEVPDWTVWTHPLPEGETLAQVQDRVDRVIADIRTLRGEVAVFAHGHLLRIFGARWVGLEPDCGRALLLDPAGVSVLSYERETPAILHWNQNADGPAPPDPGA